MEFEYRSGPHGLGSNGMVFQGHIFNQRRAAQQRPIHNGAELLLTKQDRSGQIIQRIEAAGAQQLIGKRVNDLKTMLPELMPTISRIERYRLLPPADSFIAGGRVAYMAFEGGVPGHKGQEQPRTIKGTPVGGELLAIDVDSGAILSRLTLDPAVINNGLAIANGVLYSVHEDGSVRAWK